MVLRGGHQLTLKWRPLVAFAAVVLTIVSISVLCRYTPTDGGYIDIIEALGSTKYTTQRHDFASPAVDLPVFFRDWQKYARDSEALHGNTIQTYRFQCSEWNTLVPAYNAIISSGAAGKAIQAQQAADKAECLSHGPRRRVLFLTSLHSFHTHTDRWFYHLFYDAARYPAWDTYIWGLGYVVITAWAWAARAIYGVNGLLHVCVPTEQSTITAYLIRFPGYNSSQSLADNLRHNWPLSPEFDVVFAMYTWLRPTNFSRLASYSHMRLPGNPVFARMEHEIDVSPDQARADLLDDARMRMIRFTAYTAYIRGPIGLYGFDSIRASRLSFGLRWQPPFTTFTAAACSGPSHPQAPRSLLPACAARRPDLCFRRGR
jgi:hypothetical protein